MPPTQCQAAATRGQSFLPLLPLILFLHVGPTQPAIHIPPEYILYTNLTQPPVITYQSESYTAFHLDDILLDCKASGNPAPSFRWVRDGELVRNESFNSGSITALESEDLKSYQGQYRCYASNELGTAESALINLTTEAPPVLSKEKRVIKMATEGESVVLRCNPPKSAVTPIIYWMDKKLLHIRQSDRVTIGLDGNLYFSNVLVTDTRADYTCNAQYVLARTILPKEPITLNVTASNSLKNRGPRLYRPEGTHSQYLALRGQTLTLECIPHGLPTPTVTWNRIDGLLSQKAYPHNHDRWLHIEDITESDDGDYSCTAVNTVGSVSHTYTVKVEAAPYWTKAPQSQRYSPGETVRLDCQSKGIPTPEITWKINGVPLSETNEPKRLVNGGTLILIDVSYSDTAVYQCEASNIHGTNLLNIYIHVIELPAQILTPNELEYRQIIGLTTFLFCDSFGSPRPQISWNSTSAEPVLSNSRMSQMTNGTLKITEVSLEDAGTYVCSVELSDLSITAHLLVLNGTRIVNPPQDLQVLRGDSAVLQCQYEVDLRLQDPTIQWRKGGHKIMSSASDDKYAVSKDGSLKITNVHAKDTGPYTCEVITNLDIDKASAYITVVDKPDAPHTLQLSGKKPHSVTLSWMPGSENNRPLLEYVIEMQETVPGEAPSWQKLKRVSADVTLMEIQLMPYCTYHFKVAAVNEIGTSDFSLSSEPYSTPPAKPNINPEYVRSDSESPGSLVITWKEIERRHFNGPDFRYKVSWRPAAGPGQHWEHTYTAHPPFTVNNSGTYVAYNIKVQAVNDLGDAPSPVATIGHSGEDLPLDPPTGVNVIKINNTAFAVRWTPVSTVSVQGHLLGYKIYLLRLGHKVSHHSGKHKRSLAPIEEMEREKRKRMVVVVHGDKKEQEILSGLEFFSEYELSITAFNSVGEGPRSEPAFFSTPEGVPGPPIFLRFESSSETELTLFWNPPKKKNGILTGYILQYQKFMEGIPGTVDMISIPDGSITHYTLDSLDPVSHYSFSLSALTIAGQGEAVKVNGTTLLDGEPPTSVNWTIGETTVNLSWVPGDRHRNLGFTLHVLRNISGKPLEKSEQINSTQAFYQLQELQPGTDYRLEFRHNNITYWREVLRTNRPVLPGVQNNFASQGWFIGLISAIVLLLLILLILCFIKRSKGGKYSVKDREEGQMDSETRKIKDETFGEYSDNDEKRSISQPSICVDSKRGSDDSLAEYGDSVDIQFNEDGSFIGQYSGRKDAHGHGDPHDSSGAVSPNNPNMPPPSLSFPTSVTGILGGN